MLRPSDWTHGAGEGAVSNRSHLRHLSTRVEQQQQQQVRLEIVLNVGFNGGNGTQGPVGKLQQNIKDPTRVRSFSFPSPYTLDTSDTVGREACF